MQDDQVTESTKQYLERDHAGFELVGEAEELDLLVASMKHSNKLTWQRRRGRGWPSRNVLAGPFGLVEVRQWDGWVVLRNDAPLYHATCRTGIGGRSASRFLSRDVAQAAAEQHLWLGWSDYAREPDCVPFDWDEDNLLWRNARTPRREPMLTRPAHDSAVEDNRIFDWYELMERSEPWGYPLRLARKEQARFVNQIPHLGFSGFTGENLPASQFGIVRHRAGSR